MSPTSYQTAPPRRKIISVRWWRVKCSSRGVTSSCLCKKVEGAGFPFQVKSLEDGVDDSVHAFDVDKANHGPGTPAHFDKAALDHVGGAQFAPEVPGKSEERQQLRQILLQPPDHRGINSTPARAERAKGGYCLRPALGQIDRLRSGLHFVVIALPRFL